MKRTNPSSPKSPPPLKKQKSSSSTHGKIAVGGKSHRGGIGYAKCDNETKGFTCVPIISRGKKPFNSLSPFFLGPVHDKKTGLKAKNMENFWQFLKVYPKVAKQTGKDWKWPEEVHAKPPPKDQDQSKENWTVTDAWTKWRDAGFKHSKPVRRPNGTARNNGPPLFAYYDGRKLGYVEARKVLYVPFYEELARATPVYQELLERVRGGENIMLIDVDGPDVNKFLNGRIMSKKLLSELLEETSRPYGHGFVCANALLEDLEEEG